MKKLILVLILLCFACPAWSATYTVCSSGCDYTTITACFSGVDLGADDIVEVRADTPGGTKTFSETIAPGTNDAGTSGHPLIIRARTGDIINIDGGGSRENGAYLTTNYVTLSGFRFDNHIGQSIVASSVTDITIENNRVNIDLTGGTSPSDRSAIIGASVTNMTIAGNTVTTDTASLAVISDGIKVGGGSNHTIRNNNITLRNATEWDQAHNDGIQMFDITNGSIYNNIIDQNISRSYNQGIYCEFYNYETGTPTNYGTWKVYNNVIFGYGGSYLLHIFKRTGGVATAVPTVNLQIYNNTVDAYNASSSYPFRHSYSGTCSSCGTSDIKNNIFIMRKASSPYYCSVIGSQDGMTIDYNHYYVPNASSSSDIITFDTFYTWAEWQTANHDTHGIGYSTGWVDPSLVNFAPDSPTDPDVDKGVDLSGSFTVDLNGYTRTGTWDIGAYEYQSEADTTPPVRSALAPSGEQACTSDPRNVTISLTTDEPATCKYHTSDVAYASMAGTFDGTGTTSHSKTISQACDAVYKFYVRCQDDEAVPNSNDDSTPASVEINYTIAPVAADTTKPTWTSSTIAADGRTLSLVFSEAVRRGGSYADTQVTVTPTGGAATLSYVSGENSTTLVYYISRVILSTETLTTSIAQPGDGIEDQNNNQLDAVSGKETTNDSTQSAVTGLQRTIWPSDVTVGSESVYFGVIEVGVKFQSSVAGVITGVRFHKTTNNTGTHIVNLWNTAGINLATKTVSGETETGWQQQLFDTVVHIAADTTYIASYFSPTGYYTSTANYFASSGVTNTPLTAIQTAAESGYNGAYLFTPTSAFPSSGSPTGRNYWVDVVFEQRSTLTIGAGPHSLSIGGGSQSITW